MVTTSSHFDHVVFCLQWLDGDVSLSLAVIYRVKVEHRRAEYLHEGVLFTKQTKLLIYLLFLPY